MIIGLESSLGYKSIKVCSRPALYMVLKILGGIYLFYLAVVIWRGSKETTDILNGSGGKPSEVYQSFKIQKLILYAFFSSEPRNSFLSNSSLDIDQNLLPHDANDNARVCCYG